jgi:tRNA (guanine37-N1)-methyltransferase
MRIRIYTTFPGVFGALDEFGVVKIARGRGVLEIEVIDLREFTEDVHRTTDDAPYGGGAGMVMKVEPIARALAARGGGSGTPDGAFAERVVLLSARGRPFTQGLARELAEAPVVSILCGHYKGVDERVAELLATDEVSIGDYVLSGGEIPAMVVIDAVTRLLPGVLGDFDSALGDSFQEGILGAPSWTRPEVFRDREVPAVLRSGDHERIRRFRRERALRDTLERRPELLPWTLLTAEDREMLEEATGGGTGRNRRKTAGRPTGTRRESK